MANITKQKREQMIAFLKGLKAVHKDDESVRAFNEIENHLKDKKFGIVFEEHTEEVDEKLVDYIPVFSEDETRKILKDTLFLHLSEKTDSFCFSTKISSVIKGYFRPINNSYLSILACDFYDQW